MKTLEDNWNWLTHEKALQLSKPMLDLEIAKQFYGTVINEVKKADQEIASMRFALDNCASYLESFKSDWKEGEEILYHEIKESLK